MTYLQERSLLAEVAFAKRRRQPVAEWKETYSQGVLALEKAALRANQQPLADLPAA